MLRDIINKQDDEHKAPPTLASIMRIQGVGDNIVSFLGITKKQTDADYRSGDRIIFNVSNKKHDDYLALKSTASAFARPRSYAATWRNTAYKKTGKCLESSYNLLWKMLGKCEDYCPPVLDMCTWLVCRVACLPIGCLYIIIQHIVPPISGCCGAAVGALKDCSISARSARDLPDELAALSPGDARKYYSNNTSEIKTSQVGEEASIFRNV